MLWEKCPKDNDLYVELWPAERKRFKHSAVMYPKDNKISNDLREVGNLQFKNQNVQLALTTYNISLCFAEKGSEELAKAYANRSLCFFRLKLYSNCLQDIQLAKEANYPKSLIPKLEERAFKCMEELKTNNKIRPEPELSFMTNANIPGMADCFRVEKDNNGTRVIATQDIDIGKNILIEEPCIRHMSDGVARRCYNCYKEYMNLMPCKICTKGMFCCEKCMEAGCEVNQSDNCLNECLTETFRSVLLALEAYPNVEDLMKATEEIRLRSNLWDEVQDYLKHPSPQTAYRLFFSRGVNNIYLLKNYTGKKIQDHLLQYHEVIKNPKMAEKFSSTASQRFLQHLILHHVLVINGFKGILALYEQQPRSPMERMEPLSEQRSQLFGVGHYPVGNMFNHSCSPNVFIITFDHRIVFKIVQPVKSGDELFVPYFTIGKRDESMKERHAQLYLLGWQLPEHLCKCYLCQNERFLYRELSDFDIVDKFREILAKPTEDVTRAEAIEFIRDGIKYLNENNDYHPSFNTMAVQNGLYLFWHMFPELV